MVEAATKELAMAKRFDQFVDSLWAPSQRAIDPLMGQQHATLQFQIAAQGPQRLAQFAKVRQGCKLVKAATLVGIVVI
jgi:hypothetical protein